MNAGRAPLGGAREAGLACYVAARLASGLLPPLVLSDEDRAARATAARQWLASLAMPAALRVPVTRLMDATKAPAAADQGPARHTVGAALVTVADAAASYLDGPSQAELRALAALLS